jgi:hypothetical protein
MAVADKRAEDDVDVAMHRHAAKAAAAFVVHDGGSPAIWTLVHIGYSGSGRCDVWVYRTEIEALSAAAELAVETYGGSPHAAAMEKLREKHKLREVLRLYEELEPPGHVLRVQLGYLQIED